MSSRLPPLVKGSRKCPRFLSRNFPLAENAVSNKPLQSDPRFIFDTKTIRFYAFETSNETAVAKPPGAPIGILDPLQDRTCDQITGRRKKEETLKMNHMERLVGMDAPARPGDRVIISRYISFLNAFPCLVLPCHPHPPC